MSVPFRSVFAQLLPQVPRAQFDALLRKHRHERTVPRAGPVDYNNNNPLRRGALFSFTAMP